MAVCVGCGLEVNGSGVLVVDLADPGSGLACTDGSGLSANIQHSNTDSIIISGNGTSGSPLSATVSVDTQDSSTVAWVPGREGTAALPLNAGVRIHSGNCNGITAFGDGIHAYCADSFVCAGNFGNGAFVPHGIGVGTNEVIMDCFGNACSTCPGGFWQTCNPLCCFAEGFISIQASGGRIDATSGTFDAVASLEVGFDGGGFSVVQPYTGFRMQANGHAASSWEIANMQEFNYVAYGPGDCHSFRARIRVEVFAGTATWATQPNFELMINLQPTGCC